MGQLAWDVEADVVVLGSGGAALIAALSAHHHGAAEVVVVEKSGMVGGTTAMSGGMFWIPLNHHSLEAGVEDSFEDVVTYLDHLAPGQLEDDPLSGFLEGGPAMIKFLADKTPDRTIGFGDFRGAQNARIQSFFYFTSEAEEMFAPDLATLVGLVADGHVKPVVGSDTGWSEFARVATDLQIGRAHV